jgi:hypothetical protein
MEIDETDPSANRGFLVQIDALGANVAFARPVRMPDVRAAASGVLGRTIAGEAACDGIAARDRGPKRLGGRN